jgi:hypothetical protein
VAIALSINLGCGQLDIVFQFSVLIVISHASHCNAKTPARAYMKGGTGYDKGEEERYVSTALPHLDIPGTRATVLGPVWMITVRQSE